MGEWDSVTETTKMVAGKRPSIWLKALVVIVGAVSIWSYIDAKDMIIWWMEAIPSVFALVFLPLIYRTFPLTPLLYILIIVHAVILLIGAHYTYAEVPIGDWFKETFNLSRNHYDRLGHFAQGFAPAIIARELILRTSPLGPGKWLFWIVMMSVLGFSAFYEIIEWQSVVWAGEGDTTGDFLGTQGDVWDAQKDMSLALIGAICAQFFLAKLHDHQLAELAAQR